MSAPVKNRVILGLMTFGPPGSGGRIETLPDFTACLDTFQAAGYNEVDTARVYTAGKQEAFSKEAGWKERGLTIATKWYPNDEEGHKPEILTAKIDESLKELGTDSVDIYYLHAADRRIPFQETLQAINEAHKAGKFKVFAISNFAASEVAEVCLTCKYNGWVRPTLYQGQYNAFNRAAERDLLPTLRRFGLDYVVYNPVAGGFLSGKYKSHDAEGEKGGRYEKGTAGGERLRGRYFKDDIFEALRLVEAAAQKHNLTIIECAFRWLVHHSALKMRTQGGNDGIITGVSSLAQLKENLANCEKGPLPADVIEAFEQGWKVIAGSAPSYYDGHGSQDYGYDTLDALYGSGRL